MKKFLSTILVVMVGLHMFGQEIQFPPSIIAAGGSSEGSTVNLSRWRLAPIHVITIPERMDYLNEDTDWNVSVYPIPTEDHLYLQFELPEQRKLYIQITDMSGRVIFVQEPKPYINGSKIELNVSQYSPEMYLLRVCSPDQTSEKIYRFQKL